MSIDAVTRLLVLCGRPFRLSDPDANLWLRSQLGELLVDDSVARVQLVVLASASLAWGRQWDYLVEIDLREGSDPNDVVRAAPCASLLGDFRLLGMRPTVLVADDNQATSLTADRG